MRIRLATTNDLDDIMNVYEKARETMRASGNAKQWINGYPQREMVEEDVGLGQLYVVEGDDGQAHAAFMFAIGNDATYDVIEDGTWLDDAPYGVIHRIGSDGQLRGVLPFVVDYCLQRIDNLRIDTHAENAIMHHVLAKCGFTRCGIIYCHDGSPRVAYQLHRA